MSWRVLMMVGLTAMPVLGQTQTGTDTVAIVEAAARWYASRAPSTSRVGFLLPGGPQTKLKPTAGELEAAQHGARVLHATLMPVDSIRAYICEHKNPASCGQGKFDLIVDVRVLKITGNASEVRVAQWTDEGPGRRQRSVQVGWTVLFIRSRDGWAFNQILAQDVN
jgi:hypothetical protein